MDDIANGVCLTHADKKFGRPTCKRYIVARGPQNCVAQVLRGTSMPLRPMLVGICALTLLGVLLLPAGEPPRTGPQTENRFPPLKMPTGFKATLFACDPFIEYPSVIAA